jgi:SAM-dependent methyltransferase
VKRVLEPELMLDDEQARAYAAADFSEPHDNFVRVFGETFAGRELAGYVLDLGCGPGDIALRFARAFPRCVVHGVDGAEAMLRCGRQVLARTPALAGRVELFSGFLPGAQLPRSRYDSIISNSLLHHLPDPQVLWQSIRHYAAPGAPVFVMDLCRPASRAAAQRLVDQYAAGEPEILRRDFYHSFLAAFTPAEIIAQLAAAGLEQFRVTRPSDRHVIISGQMLATGRGELPAQVRDGHR